MATESNLPVSGESGSVTEGNLEAPGNLGWPEQSRQLPMRFRDVLPEPSLPHSPGVDSSTELATPQSILPRVILHVFDSFRTRFNAFHIAREYRHRPSYDPDSFLTIEQLTNTNPNPSSAGAPLPPDISPPPPPPWPWKNMGVWRLMTWMMTGSKQKSEAEVTRLVHEVFHSEDFDRSHFIGFNAHTEMKHFDNSENIPGSKLDTVPSPVQDTWVESTISISVPTRERCPGGNGQEFVIPGLFHRLLTAIIHMVFAEKAAKWFHLTPFKRIWKSPLSGEEQHVYDELYTSDAWIAAHDEIQKQRRDDGCKLERVIAGLMLWSDATHLAQFGSASAWPIYLFFGNQSKYVRACPNSGACHPVAFIPTVSFAARDNETTILSLSIQLPDTIVGFVSSISKRKTYNDILAHCKRELFHAMWKVLLDDDFIDAYRNGIVIKCYDGKYRRVYPRIFTYSADYPEKYTSITTLCGTWKTH